MKTHKKLFKNWNELLVVGSSEKYNITAIQFNAKTLKVVSHFFRKRILMTFDHVRATFLYGKVAYGVTHFAPKKMADQKL